MMKFVGFFIFVVYGEFKKYGHKILEKVANFYENYPTLWIGTISVVPIHWYSMRPVENKLSFFDMYILSKNDFALVLL